MAGDEVEVKQLERLDQHASTIETGSVAGSVARLESRRVFPKPQVAGLTQI